MNDSSGAQVKFGWIMGNWEVMPSRDSQRQPRILHAVQDDIVGGSGGVSDTAFWTVGGHFVTSQFVNVDLIDSPLSYRNDKMLCERESPT